MHAQINTQLETVGLPFSSYS